MSIQRNPGKLPGREQLSIVNRITILFSIISESTEQKYTHSGHSYLIGAIKIKFNSLNFCRTVAVIDRAAARIYYKERVKVECVIRYAIALIQRKKGKLFGKLPTIFAFRW